MKISGMIELLHRRDGLYCHYCRRPLASAYEAHRWYHPLEDWREPFDRDAFDPASLPTIDHKQPRSRGGSDQLENLVLCCAACNTEKSDRYSYEQFISTKQG